MKKTLLFIALGLSVLPEVNAQKSNSVSVSVTPKVWLNSFDVHRDKFANNALSSENRFGLNADVNYTRYVTATNNRLYFGGGIGYGRYSEILRVQYSNVGDLWADGSYQGKSKDNRYDMATGYLSGQVFVGYSFHLMESKTALHKLNVDIGYRQMFFQIGDNVEDETLYANIADRTSDYATFEWGTTSIGMVAELNVTYKYSPKNQKRSYFVGLNATAFPTFNYPVRDGDSYSGLSNLVDYKRDINGNKVYGTPGEVHGESIFPRYASIGLRIGVDLFNF